MIEASRDRFFLERSNAAQAFFPGVWDLGAKVEGGWRAPALRAGADERRADRRGDLPGRDPNRGQGPGGAAGHGCVRGAAGGWRPGPPACAGAGFHPGTPASKDTLVWRDVNEDGVVQTTEIQVIAGSAAAPSASFDRFALGGDARVTVAMPRLGAAGRDGRGDLGEQPGSRPAARRSGRLRPRPARTGLLPRVHPAADPSRARGRPLRLLPARRRRQRAHRRRPGPAQQPLRHAGAWRRPGSTDPRCAGPASTTGTGTRSGRFPAACPARWVATRSRCAGSWCSDAAAGLAGGRPVALARRWPARRPRPTRGWRPCCGWTGRSGCPGATPAGQRRTGGDQRAQRTHDGLARPAGQEHHRHAGPRRRPRWRWGWKGDRGPLDPPGGRARRAGARPS